MGVRSGKYVNPVSNEGGSLNLMYIPTDAELAQMTFKDEENKAAFKKFIEDDSYLSSHRGQYSERGAKVAPWQNRINLKVAQDFIIDIAGKPTTLQIGADYTFNAPTVQNYRSTFNTWQLLLSARLFF